MIGNERRCDGRAGASGAVDADLEASRRYLFWAVAILDEEAFSARDRPDLLPTARRCAGALLRAYRDLAGGDEAVRELVRKHSGEVALSDAPIRTWRPIARDAMRFVVDARKDRGC
jgi:hypothetical protein